MRKYFVCGVSGLALISASALAQSGQSEEDKAAAFFKNNLQQSAENYVSARIEQSLSERFRNIEIDITDLDGEDTKFASRETQCAPSLNLPTLSPLIMK